MSSFTFLNTSTADTDDLIHILSMTKETETRVKLADLPEPVVEDVRRQAYDYTVPIVVDYTPHGTGTLVQIDNWLGILTAEHVTNDPDDPKLSLNWTGYPERFLRTVLGPFAHDLSISTNALRLIMTERTSKEYGPDLAFIVLPPSPRRAQGTQKFLQSHAANRRTQK